MKKLILSTFLLVLPLLASAYDIAVENADGVMIYYNYSQNGLELSVTGVGNSYYSGSLFLPDEVTYMNRTRKVTRIEDSAFSGYSELTNITLPNCLKSIGKMAFKGCKSLTSLTIPASLNSIENDAFSDCSGLNKVIIKDIAAWCNIKIPNKFGNTFGTEANPLFYARHLYSDNDTEIKQLIIPEGVMKIGDYAFYGCQYLTSITIPNSVTTIGDGAFHDCQGLTTLTIPNNVTVIGNSAFSGCIGLSSIDISNSVTTIGRGAFWWCKSLTSITIPSSVTSIKENAFCECSLNTVISQIKNPNGIFGKGSNNYQMTFDLDTYNNATLCVPKGTIDVYKSTEGWADFLFIEEEADDTSVNEKCKTPSIIFKEGKIVYLCETEGAICYSTITDSDITSYTNNEVQLSATYEISVYATKSGFTNSDVATATLVWTDAIFTETTPDTTTLAKAVTESFPVLISAQNGTIIVRGEQNGLPLTVYTADGKILDSATIKDGQASISTNLQRGGIAIVKVGSKSVKVKM